MKRTVCYVLASIAAFVSIVGLAALGDSFLHMLIWFVAWAIVAIVLLYVAMTTPVPLDDDERDEHCNDSYQPHFARNLAGLPKDYTAINLVTTGDNPAENQIMEFGAVRMRNGRPVSKMSMLVNPEQQIPESVVKKTGLTQETLERQPEVGVGLRQFFNFVGCDPLVSPYIDRDRTFLEINARRNGLHMPPNEQVDTLKIDHSLFDQDHKRQDLLNRCAVNDAPVARALPRAETTVQCYEWLNRCADERVLQAAAVPTQR